MVISVQYFNAYMYHELEVLNCDGDLRSPVHAGSADDNHARPVQHPVVPGDCLVRLDGRVANVLHGRDHQLLYL